MRKNYHPKIRFYIGRADGNFVNNGWRNESSAVFGKKSNALVYANQLLEREGQVYVKVSYGGSLYNAAIFHSYSELIDTFSIFTEQSLLDFSFGGVS